jgi:hypothetical protein
LLDGVEGHGWAPTTFREEGRRVKPDNGTWMRGLTTTGQMPFATLAGGGSLDVFYIQQYFQIARILPGLLEYTWVQFQLHFPLDQVERFKRKAL